MLRFCSFAVLIAMIIAPGCGQRTGRAAVAGNVTLDGKPLQNGSIVFLPADGVKGAVAGGNIENGRYKISSDNGPACGRNIIEIRSSHSTGRMIQPYGPGTSKVQEIVQTVASQYNTKSTLKFDIKPGNNKADFEVLSHR